MNKKDIHSDENFHLDYTEVGTYAIPTFALTVADIFTGIETYTPFYPLNLLIEIAINAAICFVCITLWRRFKK